MPWLSGDPRFRLLFSLEGGERTDFVIALQCRVDWFCLRGGSSDITTPMRVMDELLVSIASIP